MAAAVAAASPLAGTRPSSSAVPFSPPTHISPLVMGFLSKHTLATPYIHTLSESKIRNRLTSGLAFTWTRASLMFNTLSSSHGKLSKRPCGNFLLVEAQHHRHYTGDHSFIILSIRSKTTSRREQQQQLQFINGLRRERAETGGLPNNLRVSAGLSSPIGFRK
ncbi:hypothetical protein DAPPUDRAFT_242387 [Daphnia pulex]|uniref:Uncharacterized protein n=1 Tax=Daphnia pulex TaxID=6669 RepID=E9GGJ3_DAPPU|nr:hypothetical protein DAPPUDRAFT_242387 [Daphnia pulex]|eukprot:EFX81481.1 hypothetical protein DAPPUDRAFT_242387 [Daphnia pulex]